MVLFLDKLQSSMLIKQGLFVFNYMLIGNTIKQTLAPLAHTILLCAGERVSMQNILHPSISKQGGQKNW